MGVNVLEGEMSWKRRLAIVLSFLWLAVFVAVGISERDGFTIFVALGLLPVATLWGVAWVWSAYRRQKAPKETSPSAQPLGEPGEANNMDWYVSRDGEQEGPFTAEHIRLLTETGGIKSHDLVWRTGMGGWKPVIEISGLLTPPPLVIKNEIAPQVEVAANHSSPEAVTDSKPIGSGPALPQMSLPINEGPEVLSFPLATPWPRAFARIFDIWWESILIGGAAAFVLGQYSSAFLRWVNQPGSEYLFGIILLPFVLLFDAAVFRLAGNTPGKAMLGIRVVSLRGTPLEFGDYLRRNFSLWSSGLGLGIPLVILFTLWRQEKRLRNGQQTSYDEKIGSRVWSKPIGKGQKLGFAIAFFSLFAVMAVLNFQGKEAEREATRVAVAKSYSWVNPVTNVSATIAPQWKYSSVDNPDGQNIQTFTESTGYAIIVFGVEYANALALHDYATAFQQSNAKRMSFVDGGKFSEHGGIAYWEAMGTVPDVAGTRLHVRVIQVGGAFWRQVTIQSKPFDYSDPLLEPLQSALWRTVL